MSVVHPFDGLEFVTDCDELRLARQARITTRSTRPGIKVSAIGPDHTKRKFVIISRKKHQRIKAESKLCMSTYNPSHRYMRWKSGQVYRLEYQLAATSD